MGFISAVSAAFGHGGIWMWAILIAQIVSISIILERVFQLYVLRAKNQKTLGGKFEKLIKRGQISDVAEKANYLGFRNPIGLVVKAGAKAIIDMGGREEIQSRMDEVLLNENRKFETRIGFLSMLANVGTLLGLLGTIIGLIKAFSAVGNVDPATKATMLSQGISMAMNTTAYGLIMAIPALIMFSVLQNRANELSEDLNQGALKLFNWFSFNYDTPKTRTVRKKLASRR